MNEQLVLKSKDGVVPQSHGARPSMSYLSRVAVEQGIRFYLVAFTDLDGVLRAKLVPASAIGDVEESGAGFAGFAARFDLTPADADIIARPDPSSMFRLPWKPDVAWVPADLYMNDAPFEQSPRHVLKCLIQKAADRGFEMRTGVEPEFFLIQTQGLNVMDGADRQPKPCYDQMTIMRNYDVVRTICDASEQLGWEPYQCDHEDANGQYELNWKYASALVTADRHTFFKFMVRSIAEQHGMRATFMPKPFERLTGSGCHAHVSFWRGERNLFLENGARYGVSDLCHGYVDALLNLTPESAAITNPSVNSYKRLNARETASGATWSPTELNWGGNDRTQMVRVPAPGRIEYRLGDGSANPYLLQAALLIGQLENSGRTDAPASNGGTPHAPPRRPLARNLLDAVRAFERSDIMRSHFGAAFVEAYVKLRYQEWERFHASLSEWERTASLDC